MPKLSQTRKLCTAEKSKVACRNRASHYITDGTMYGYSCRDHLADVIRIMSRSGATFFEVGDKEIGRTEDGPVIINL